MSELSSQLETLRTWRECNARNSREVVDMWLTIIGKNINNIGKDRHIVLEQVCIAALDCYELGIAQRCIERLNIDFPKSLRVKKLESMFLEADGKFEAALELLDSIIAADETYSAAKKRKVAIYKALGRNADAIKELADYLKICMMDVEAWQELSELYINENDFGKAAFCVEELILSNPHNHLLHQRYADIKYTQGGMENIELAKAYYCQALKLNSKNIRALYGLYLTGTAIISSQKCSAQKKKDANKLIEWSLKAIQNKYSNVEVADLEKRLGALEV